MFSALKAFSNFWPINVGLLILITEIKLIALGQFLLQFKCRFFDTK